MSKGIIVYKIGVLCLPLILLYSCTTVEKKTASSISVKEMPVVKRDVVARRVVKKNVLTNDVKFFYDLQEVDLFQDGRKEIVAVYATGENLSGVKVIEDKKGRGNIIFTRIFTTPNTKFKIINGIPAIVFEEVNLSTDRRTKRNYLWNGKTFVLAETKK